MSTKLEDSLKSGEHQKLLQLTGEWEGRTKTWFEAPEPVDESPITGTIKPLFDGRFIMHEYNGSFQDKTMQGIAIYGYHLMTQQFQSAWVDTFHMGTGIMFSKGQKPGKFLDVTGNYEAAAGDPILWGWRTAITIVNQDRIIITAYNISPDGKESRATETVYNRKQQT